jgi:hypothetical protein
VNATIGLTYEHGTQTFQEFVTIIPGFAIPVAQTENYDRYGVSPALSWQATDKLSTSLSYNYYLRQSNLPDRGYTFNGATLSFHYTF